VKEKLLPWEKVKSNFFIRKKVSGEKASNAVALFFQIRG